MAAIGRGIRVSTNKGLFKTIEIFTVSTKGYDGVSAVCIIKYIY